MKVTKAKCLNTDLAKHLFGKSSRLGVTERIEPFPRGLARRVAASYFLGFEFASRERKHFRSSGSAEPFDRTAPIRPQRLPVYEVATRRSVREEAARCVTLPQRPRQLAAKQFNQIRVQALCFGDFHLGQQM